MPPTTTDREYNRGPLNVRSINMRFWSVVAMSAGLMVAACGSGGQPDGSVRLTVNAPVEMPFHGPGGPGTEPMYISFNWTVVVAASEGADIVVGPVRTRLIERASGAVLTAEGGPVGNVPAGAKVELRQQTSGTFLSSLYPGDWLGVTTVEVSGRNGTLATVSTSFTFR
jgi:hypothetical protein